MLKGQNNIDRVATARRSTVLGLAALIFSGVPLATAQEAGATATTEPAPKVRKRPANRMLEEVVVTAQKREDRAQDVPIAIQAFGSESLDAQNIGATEELGPLVPSLTFTQAAGFTLIYLRGVGTSQFVPSADPSIATYTDGIYLPTGQAGTTSLGAVERVEVLKGPQGTLFGRNTIGGAINVITKKPRDELLASVKAQYTDLNYQSISASVSTPVTDWFSVGLAAAYDRKKSFVKRTNAPTPIGRTKTQRLQLAFFPTDSMTVDLTAYSSEQSDTNLSIGQNSQPSNLGRDAYGIESEGDDYEVDNDFLAQSYSEQKLLYGTFEWQLPWFDFKILASEQEFNIPMYDYDFDGTDEPIVGFDTRGGEFPGLDGEYSHIETAEIQFVSNSDSWMSEKFEWVAGLYYYHGIGAFDPARFSAQPGLVTSALGVDPAVVNLIQDITGVGPVMLYLSGILETDSYSAYFQATYSILHWLDVTLGGRYQDEDRFLTKSETNALNPATGELENVFMFPLKDEQEANFSPKFQITARPTDDTMVYASYGEGYKSGTYNIVAIYQEPDYIAPEHVISYEIGAKTEFFDGNLRFNGAIFFNEIEDLQDGFVSLLSGGAVSFNTAPGAETKGIEFDFQWVPMPELNPGLVVTGNAAYVEAIYTDFENGEGFEEDGGLYNANLDLTGFKLRNTPRRSGGLGILQSIPFEFGSVEVGVDASHNSRTFYNANNTVSEDPRTIYNARVSFEYEPWRTRLTVFGENITDTRYHSQQFETDFGLLTTLAAPRSLGVRLQWDY